MDLREYEQAKFELATLVRSAAAIDAEQGHPQQDAIRELFSRLAEDRFNLVVVGRFSRGKSSLMNAVLGLDRLPTGIRPLTSVITTVTYGSPEKAVIHYQGFNIPEDIPLAALPQYVTEHGNPGNQRRVRIAEVHLPAELLRRGFHFIDTPGLGSPIVENTRTTERFLPEADAFVLVTSYEGPLSEEEVRFLQGAARAAQRVFVVVNKHDMVTPAEREEAGHYLREQLGNIAGDPNIAVFSVSARDGLAAKLSRNSDMLAASGIAAFEAELVRYLIHDKSREFLLRLCHRVAAVLRDLPQNDDGRLGEQLVALARRIDGSSAAVPSVTAVPAGALGPMRPCEMCSAVTQQCYDFLRKFQYEITVSSERQRHLAERGGLCGFHTWYYETVASPHGTCVGFAPVLDRLASRLRSPAVQPGAGVESGPCLFCEARAAAEAAAVNAIAARLRTESERTLAALSDLCLPHFRLLVASVTEPHLAARLHARQAAVLQRVAEDMRRFALKHEGVRRYLASEDEMKAAERALLLLAGHRTLNTPAPQ